jgi:hypothetical protein
MIIRTLDDVTADALAAMSSTEDPRLRDILYQDSLIRTRRPSRAFRWT